MRSRRINYTKFIKMVRGNYVLNVLNEKLENCVGGKGVVQETLEWV